MLSRGCCKEIFCNNGVSFRDSSRTTTTLTAQMKTGRTTRGAEGTFSKGGRMKKNFQANLKEREGERERDCVLLVVTLQT